MLVVCHNRYAHSHYLAPSSANDFCQNSNRSTISANDVLMAMEELEFPDFVPQLKETLETFKKDQASKKAAKKN